MFQLAIGTNITRPKSKGPKDEVGRAVLSAGHFLQTHPPHVFLLVSGGGRIPNRACKLASSCAWLAF